MATKKAPKKFTAKPDAKTEEQQLIQATVNSNYSLLIPCLDCEYVYVRNPLDGKIKHFSTKSDALAEFVKQLSDKGLGGKIEKDFLELESSNDERWGSVIKFLKEKQSL